jgi:hypothetical protein
MPSKFHTSCSPARFTRATSHNSDTKCSGDLLEKLAVSHPLKNFAAFYVTRRFLAVCHMNPIHILPYVLFHDVTLCAHRIGYNGAPTPSDPSRQVLWIKNYFYMNTHTTHFYRDDGGNRSFRNVCMYISPECAVDMVESTEIRVVGCEWGSEKALGILRHPASPHIAAGTTTPYFITISLPTFRHAQPRDQVWQGVYKTVRRYIQGDRDQSEWI